MSWWYKKAQPIFTQKRLQHIGIGFIIPIAIVTASCLLWQVADVSKTAIPISFFASCAMGLIWEASNKYLGPIGYEDPYFIREADYLDFLTWVFGSLISTAIMWSVLV